MDRTELQNLISSGLSVQAIGERLGVSHATVRYWMAKHGLTTARGQQWRASFAARGESARDGICEKHGPTRFVRRDSGFRCEQCRSEAVTKRRRALKRRLVEEAGGACVLCGYDRSTAALQFHHVDPSQKSFTIAGAGMTRSLAKARAEAAKCVLLCGNCHAEVEVGFRRLPFSNPASGGDADPR
jgi:transposase-like protein